MYQYKPDLIAKTRIPGHNFVHWPFRLKYIPPVFYLVPQSLLITIIYMKGSWTSLVSIMFIASFLVPAITSILGKWSKSVKVVHAPLTYLILIVLGYVGNINQIGEIILVLAFIVWIGIFWYILGSGLSDPLKRMLEILDKIKNGDLTSKVILNFPRKDELGQVTEGINAMLDEINSIVSSVKNSIVKVADSGKELNKASDLSEEKLTTMKNNIDSIRDKIVLLDQDINISSQSATDVNQFISDVAGLISSQAAAISQSSSTIEEMSASIQNIANVSEGKLEIAQNLEKKASFGEQSMKEVVELIKKVADSAHLIMDMISVINGIAEQTNLLAMNAAIEAAHAGDAGKGFAVVADEIRKLAEDTGKNSKEISNSLKDVIQHIRVSEESTKKTGDIFIDIVQHVKEVAGSMMEMKAATEEMAIGNEQILDSIGSVVSISEKVKSSSGEMDEKVSKITESMRHLSSISYETKVEMSTFSTRVSEVQTSMQEVSQIGSKNMASVSELKKHVTKFKLVDSVENQRGPGILSV